MDIVRELMMLVYLVFFFIIFLIQNRQYKDMMESWISQIQEQNTIFQQFFVLLNKIDQKLTQREDK